VFAISACIIPLTNTNLFDLSKQDQSIFNDVDHNLESKRNLDAELGVIDITEDSSMYVPIMKWRQEYSHPLFLTRDKSYSAFYGNQRAQIGHKQKSSKSYVTNIADECQAEGGDSEEFKHQDDHKLKEMVFAGTNVLEERRNSHRNSKTNLNGSAKREK